MSKLASIFLMTAISLSFFGTAYAPPPSGLDLLAEDKKQIELLKSKAEELKNSGGNVSVINALVTLAEEMMELNNKRHALHEATRSYAQAIDIFSGDIKGIIEKVNKVLTEQADGVIRNEHAIALLKPTEAAGNSEHHDGGDEKAAAHDDNTEHDTP